MKNNILILSLCALVGYLAGFTVADREHTVHSADLNSEAPNTNVAVTFKNLPCPTEEEYQKLAAAVKLEIPEGESLDVKCDEEPRAFIAKSLLFLTKIKINFPEDWPEKLKEHLGNPYKFVSERTNKMTLDLNQVESVAYNKVQIKEIFLGGQFFPLDPYDTSSVLVHEARHSDPPAGTHVYCIDGDIPRSQGACDEKFAMDVDHAGSYSYDVLFNAALSLYGEGLSQVDREKAMIESMAILGARFQEVPQALARKTDILVILTQDKKLKVVHPQTGATQEITLKFEDPSEHPVRIEFSPAGNALQIHTNLERVWLWAPLKKQTRLYSKLLLMSDKVKDVSRMIVPFKQVSLNVIRYADQSLKFAEFSLETKATALKPYPLNLGRQKNIPTSPFQRMFLGLSNHSIFLTEAGGVHFAPQVGDEEVFGEPAALKSPHGWTTGTGGVMYESLFLIDRRGDLSYVKVSEEETESETTTTFSLFPSELKIPAPLKKYAQGLQVHMGLNNNGQIYVWRYEDQEGQPHKLPLQDKVADFVLTQIVDYEEPIGKQVRPYHPFLGPKDFSKPPYLFGLSN